MPDRPLAIGVTAGMVTMQEGEPAKGGSTGEGPLASPLRSRRITLPEFAITGEKSGEQVESRCNTRESASA